MEKKVYDAAHRDAAVKKVLMDPQLAGPLSPSEIARRVDEDWCVSGRHRYGMSAPVSVVLKRIGAVKRSRGNWTRNPEWEAV